MNLVEKLMRAGEMEKETATLRSQHLSNLLGEETSITIREVTGRQLSAVHERAKGEGDSAYESTLLCCMFGVIEPDLKNEKLQEHFKVTTPKDLCEKLFSAEAYPIAEKILELSGATSNEEMVKNGFTKIQTQMPPTCSSN